MKLFSTFLLIYLLVLLFSFISELTYKKRTIAEIRNNAKSIVKNASILYFIFVVASIVYQLAGVNFNN